MARKRAYGGRVRLLAWQLEHARDRLARRLDGLGDPEFFWEPVPGCATVRPDGGGWVLDPVRPRGGPAPFATIAWRLVHLAHRTAVCHDYTFGPGTADPDSVEVPGTAAGAVLRWNEVTVAFGAALESTPEALLDETVRPAWMEPTSTVHLVHTVIEEQVRHGAEIGCLRDLYRAWAPEKAKT